MNADRPRETPSEPEVDLERLLIESSRTFALAIPLLPEPTRRQVTLSYLLFRVADTFEDAADWPRERRIEALDRFCTLLERPAPEETAALCAFWAAEVPCAKPGYHDLLAHLPQVLDDFFALPPDAIVPIRHHTQRTARGMAGFVARTDERGELRLRSEAELREYCYIVAGIVGELLTELFLLGRPDLAPAAPILRSLSATFGEGLQLVNILKDSSSDALEGRRYLPEAVERSAVMALARRDLERAGDYVLALQRHAAERGLVAFTALPVQLAEATLDRLDLAGPGAKLRRPEVFAIIQRLNRALDRGEVAYPALPPEPEPHPDVPLAPSTPVSR